MKYTDYPCQKCWLVDKCVLNGKTIYKHQCSGVKQKEKPKYLQQAESILKDVDQINFYYYCDSSDRNNFNFSGIVF